MTRLKASSVWLSNQNLNCCSPALNTPLISMIGRQDVSSQSSLLVLAAVSPLVREVLSSSCCHLPPTTHLLLPQFEEAVVALLAQLVAGGKVVASLKECSQVLEMIQVLGMDIKSFIMENNEANVLMKLETECDTSDCKHEEEEKIQDVDVNIGYESKQLMVRKAEQSSFVQVKAKIKQTEEDSALSEMSRARLTPLVSTTPPVASSCSLKFSSEQDLVSIRPVLARKKYKKLQMPKEEIRGSGKMMIISSGINSPKAK